jgi:uncharacterized protein (DUF952 family)
MNILHITTRPDWQAALEAGSYRADSLDSEGFIHCSTSEQIAATANRFYAGQSDLLLLHIDPELLAAELRWEPADGQDFPHIYGLINLDAVVGVESFGPDGDGVFHYGN